jgi:outer membrane lipoprotein-sorting protein
MKWITLATALFAMTLAPAPAGAQTEKQRRPTAEQLLERMDQNLTFETRRARMVMTVEGRRTRTFEMVSYGRGEEDAAIEYLSPARDRGTRMLKLGDELWIYLPGADRVQKISGHMMRQGMMGSDVSYEDLMASRELRRLYASRVTGEASHGGRPCWTLEMRARDDAVTYPRRVVCVDKETFIPIKQELYALSGMLLKTWTMSDVKEFAGGRRFPTRMSVEDHVKKGSVTRIELTELEFGVRYPKEVFSLRWLERR